MKTLVSILFCLIAVTGVLLIAETQVQATTMTYTAPGMVVGVGDQGILSGPYDLTSYDSFILKATLDLTGLNDDYHTIFKLGVHDTATSENLMLEDGHGVWLATDHQWWNPGDFDPDPIGSPSLDIDDKLILQRDSLNWNDESAYNLPGMPPIPGDNHNIWFDRDGVDQWQDDNPLSIDGANYNTLGIYYIELHIVATSNTVGTAYLKVNGLWQGFETDIPKDWTTMEMSPAGMTFTGDMTNMQVFFGVKGWAYDGDPDYTNPDNTSTVQVVPEPATILLLGAGLAGVGLLRRRFKN